MINFDVLSQLNNIGHKGNIGSSDDSGGSGGGQDLYGNMFGQGAFGDIGEKNMENIEQTFSGWLGNSHNMTMLTFGLGSIFSMQSPMDLQSASLFKFMDLASPVAGFTLPKVLGIGAGRGR